MRDRIIRHINSAVAQRLNFELVVPWEGGSEALGSGAAPFFQPFDDQFKFMLSFGAVSIKSITLNMFFNKVFPIFFAVLKEPLVAAGHNTFIPSSRYNF